MERLIKNKKAQALLASGCLMISASITLLHLLPLSSRTNLSLLAESNGDLWWRNSRAEPKFQQCQWWNNQQYALPELSNGYMIVDCTGGLNQMRRDFCDGVGIARLLNATLLLPQFERTPYWNDSSGFADIFDADYFIEAMKDYVHIVKELPSRLTTKQAAVVDCQKRKLFDYLETVLPVLLQEKLVIIRPAASQRSDRYPAWAKASRCQACYQALRLVKHLRTKAERILDAIPRPFLALHLRFEPDMIAYSRCVYTNLSQNSLTAIEAARENKAVFTGDLAVSWRNRGKCPLTPAEAAFILRSLRIPTSMAIYLASGDGLLEEADFTSVFPNIFRKQNILGQEMLRSLHSNSKAALDYHIAVQSDVYAATYFGNMDKMVVAMRALRGGAKTVVLDRKAFSVAVTEGLTGTQLADRMWEVHRPILETGENLPLPDCFCRSRN